MSSPQAAFVKWRKPCSPFYSKESETDGPSGLAEAESFIVGKDYSLGISV